MTSKEKTIMSGSISLVLRTCKVVEGDVILSGWCKAFAFAD
jgi:hypothetical protein